MDCTLLSKVRVYAEVTGSEKNHDRNFVTYTLLVPAKEISLRLSFSNFLFCGNGLLRNLNFNGSNDVVFANKGRMLREIKETLKKNVVLIEQMKAHTGEFWGLQLDLFSKTDVFVQRLR